MKKRKSYDTRIKYLARQGLLPDRYLKKINRSLICKWKQEPRDKYVGYELHEEIEDLYDLMRLIKEDQKFRKIVTAAYRLNITFKNIIRKHSTLTTELRNNKEEIIKTIQSVGPILSLKFSCRLMGLNMSTYRVWSKQVYYKCDNSLLKLCIFRKTRRFTSSTNSND
jgi:hypothetical protein